MKRLLSVKKIMDELKIDGVLLTSEENMHYFCGFSPSEGMVLILKNAAYHLVDSRYTIAAKRHAESTGLTVIEIEAGFLPLLNELLKKHSVHKLGYEDQKTTVSAYEQMKKELPCDFLPLGNKITALRNVKDAKELEYLMKAQRIAENAYLDLLNHIQVGKTEKELATLLDYLMLQNGSDGASFHTILISGKNTSMPHGVPSEKKIEAGDFVTMDFGATYKGYHSDMTRTVAVGGCSDEMKLVYNTVLQAQLAAIEFLGSGKACRDVYKVAFDIIDKAGYGSYFKHGLGHGVGLEIHEGYSAAPKSEDTYVPGNVTSMEPGIYLPEKFGVRIEDVLYIGETENINLATVSKDLIVL